MEPILWIGEASWVEELKSGDVNWTVKLQVMSAGMPVKQNKVWTDPVSGKPVVVLSRELFIDGKPVGMTWRKG